MPSKSKRTQRRKKSKSAEQCQDPNPSPKSADTKTRKDRKAKKPAKNGSENESTISSVKNHRQKKKTLDMNRVLQVMMTGSKDPPTKARPPSTPTTSTPVTSTPRKLRTPEKIEKFEEVPSTPGVSPNPTPVKRVVSKEVATPPIQKKASDTPSCDAAATGTTTTTTTDSVPANEKWSAEPIALKWLEKTEFPKVKLEFESLQKMAVDIEKDCKKWKANPKLNQSNDYPALDANLIKHESGDYVNMNLVEVPLKRNVYIGQIPVKGSEESFWKAFFDARITYMTILNEESVEFFPNGANDFRHYGTMFVNNRKAEVINEDVTRFVIEVLPSGCSNSILSTITVIKNWLQESVHAKQAVVIKEILEMSVHMTTAPPDETDAIVSKRGAGRAGYFAALMIAVTRLDQMKEPNIAEIVKSIRAQRPRAVDTLTQYVSLYISLFYYIKRKSNSGEADKKDDGLAKKCNLQTQAFTQALVAEIAANFGRSTITLLPMK